MDHKLASILEVSRQSLKEVQGKLFDSPISFAAQVHRARGFISGYCSGADLKGDEVEKAIIEFEKFCEKLLAGK